MLLKERKKELLHSAIPHRTARACDAVHYQHQHDNNPPPKKNTQNTSTLKHFTPNHPQYVYTQTHPHPPTHIQSLSLSLSHTHTPAHTLTKIHCWLPLTEYSGSTHIPWWTVCKHFTYLQHFTDLEQHSQIKQHLFKMDKLASWTWLASQHSWVNCLQTLHIQTTVYRSRAASPN